MTRVLFVVSESGCERRRCAVPLETLDAAGVEVAVATPSGECPNFDSGTDAPDEVEGDDGDGDEADRRTRERDPRIAEPIALADVTGEDYDAVVFVGGYGAVLDVNRDPAAAALLREIIAGDDGVALVAGHAVGLVSAARLDADESNDDRQFTGFPSASRPDTTAGTGAVVRIDGDLLTAPGPLSHPGAVRALLDHLGLAIPSHVPVQAPD